MASPGANDTDMAPIVPVDRRRSMPINEDGEAGDTCRICRGEGTSDQPLFYPCKCSGSIRYVHQDCLMEWLSHSQKKYCELCKTSFRFTKLYDQSMPDSLPVPLVARQVALHGIKTLGKWFRYTFVTLVWICILPWCIRHIWRGLFWLADGSWMTEQDLHYLVTKVATLPTLDSGTRNFTLHLNSTSTISQSAAYSVWTNLFSLLSSDALLRGLLRLVTYRSPTNTTMLPVGNSSSVHNNGTSFLVTLRAKRSSLLSDVHSLNSFTKYDAVNNGLVDILEGQLVCLSVIAAFILVFLIREWVINQQPVHLMPDPDQAPQAPANQPQPNDDARRVVRGHQNPRVAPEQEGQRNVRGLNIAQRPRAIPRPRRMPTEAETIPVDRTGDLATLTEDSHTTTSDPPSPFASGEEPIEFSPIPAPTSAPLDVQAPPLQRGIFDEAAGIRRSIEERPMSSAQHDPPDGETSTSGGGSSAFIANHVQQAPSSSQRPAPPAFDFSALALRNNSDEFTFSHMSNLPSSDDFLESMNNIDSTQPPDSTNLQSDLVSEGSATAIAPEEADSDQESVQQMTPQSSDSGMIAEDGSASSTRRRTEETASANVPEATAPRTFVEWIADCLWHTDEVADLAETEFTAGNGQASGEVGVETGDLPRNEILAAPPPQPPPPPAAAVAAAAHEPNIQFGIDLNDPNAMDDAEDLEGLLELIGMEGPIAGMIQNIIFSVFLIALTLSASVWCPYIWGKIALLIMSNPVGIFVKAPLYFVSRVADILVDLMLLCAGVGGFVLTSVARTAKVILMPLVPAVGRYIKINAVEDLAISVTQTSSIRLEKALHITVAHLRPDLPTFSMQSHHALRVFKGAFSDIGQAVIGDLTDTVTKVQHLTHVSHIFELPWVAITEVTTFPVAMTSAVARFLKWGVQISTDLKTPVFADTKSVDLSLVEWSTKDKILTVLIGYAFFAAAGVAYLKISRFVLSLKTDEEVQGMFADSLRQAGGVLKVIIVIGIEMIVFPLYCGCLLDIALLPLFREATLHSRVNFIFEAPMTGLFIHWFIGTCYMFHFALFVSMCRKIMRRGVLYFIRDPDDPTFHPVRDVLERPVFTQLSKIAFSACVYGGLVILCLGGVVWSIGQVDGIFPIQWATDKPRLAFPIDLIFFNFILPFAIRKAEPSKKISTMYEWWFRKCAERLRLSHFLFGEERAAEMRPYWARSSAVDVLRNGEKEDLTSPATSELGAFEGSWVRAPASDQVRIPRGTRTFLEVNENNERIDGQVDKEQGLHGKKDERFSKFYIPPRFKVRIGIFIFMVWVFAASTGAASGILPLLIGRTVIKAIARTGDAPNDLYAFTIGVHVCGVGLGLGLIISKYRNSLADGVQVRHLKGITRCVVNTAQYVLGLFYLGIIFGFLLPFLLSLVGELYIHMPVYAFIADTSRLQVSEAVSDTVAPPLVLVPTIHVVQTWTLGILYLRLLVRAALQYPTGRSRPAVAIRSILRNGVLHPDVWLASRALILPIVLLCTVLITLPPILARLWIVTTRVQDGPMRMFVYRCSYPVLLAIVVTVYSAIVLRGKIEGWQARVRDEVYLVGERLHNFSDPDGQTKEKTGENKPDHKRPHITQTQRVLGEHSFDTELGAPAVEGGSQPVAYRGAGDGRTSTASQPDTSQHSEGMQLELGQESDSRVEQMLDR